ncbi:MAG: MerR family transcriptional regulator [Pseudomonadota bacterium]
MVKTPQIPNKLYFRIGEVSELVGVQPYVLRYWESEFPDIKPSKSKSGQRLYKRRDVESLVRIKQLLYEERFTIDGARKRLKELIRADHKEHRDEPKQLEVFIEEGVEDTNDEDTQEEYAAEKPVVKTEKVNTKVFLKLKKDLESLLDIVKQ